MRTVQVSKDTLTGSFLHMCFSRPVILMDTRLSVDDFEGQEQEIFKAMSAIVSQGGNLDTYSLTERLGYLPELDNLEGSAGWKHREKAILDASRKKTVIEAAQKILEGQHLPSDVLLDSFYASIETVDRTAGYSITSLSKLAETVKTNALSHPNGSGVPSGFFSLDELTNGWQKRSLYYIGARPSQGKTALLLNFALNCKCKFGFLSAESGKEELVTRALAIKNGVDATELFSNRESGWRRIVHTDFEGLIYDEPNMSLQKLKMVARHMIQQMDCKVLFIDYLQIIRTNFSVKTKREAVMLVSLALKQLARDLNVPIICACQLNREGAEEGKKPQLAQFGETSQIEQDADCAVLIWNHKETCKSLAHVGEIEMTDLLVQKNRNGRLGAVRVKFDKSTLKFMEV